VGPRALAALAMVAEVVHGAPCRFSDPARFSLAHGGKDGHPFPVPLAVYDRTLEVYRQAIEHAKLGRDDKLAALARLAQEAQRLEATARGPSLEAFVAEERAASPSYGGRTIHGPAAAAPNAGRGVRDVASAALTRAQRAAPAQLRLPGLRRA